MSDIEKTDPKKDVHTEISDKESQFSREHLLAQQCGLDPEFYFKIQLVNEAIQQMGFGWYQWKVFFAAGLGWFADNIWLQAVSIVMTYLQYEFQSKGQIPDPPAVHIKEMTLCLYAGLMVGAFFWGVLADVIGRYKVWNTTIIWSGIFGIATGGVETFTQLGAMMAMIGFGVGGNLPVDGAMCLEFLPGTQQHILTLLSVFWSVGQLVASLIAWAFIARYSKNCTNDVICDKSNNSGWRYTYYTLGAMMVFLGIVRLFVLRIDESPKFLVSAGKYEKAHNVIQHIAADNGVDTPFTLEELEACGRELKSSQDTEPLALSAVERVREDLYQVWNVQFKSLFATKRIAISTSLIVLCYAAIGLAYPLWFAFLGSFLATKGASTGNSSIDDTFGAYSYQAAAGIPGSIIAAYLVRFKFIGRKIGLAVFTAMTGAFLFGITGSTTAPAINGLTSMVSFASMGMYGILYGYAPELFPTPFRGTGDSLCASFNRLLGFFAPVIAVWSPNASDVNGPVYAAAAIFMFAAVISLLLPIETVGLVAL